MAENILDKILKAKHKEVAGILASTHISGLVSQAHDTEDVRDFVAAITSRSNKPVNLIAEIKKASPSKGVIRDDFDPVRLAEIYSRTEADAISVLTDEQFFQGKLDYINLVRNVVDIPILRKDFIVDPVQVYESRVAGADAILLIAAALDPEMLLQLQGVSAELGMGVLLEIHNEQELEMVLDLSGSFTSRWVLGINNRDLSTFKVDLDTTIDLLDRTPDGISVVSESGISTRQDIELLAGAGVSAVLVGERFMSSDDVGMAVHELFGCTDGKGENND